MKPWFSLATLLVLCAGLWGKFHHVSFRMPEIAWWGWPLVVVAGIALNVGFFIWLARMSRESSEAEMGAHLQVAAAVVLLLMIVL